MDKDAWEFLDRKFNAIDEKFEETKSYFGVEALVLHFINSMTHFKSF